MEEIAKILLDQGLSFLVITLLAYFLYRFLNIKLEAMKNQLETECKHHKYVLTGSLKLSDDKKEFAINGELDKVLVE